MAAIDALSSVGEASGRETDREGVVLARLLALNVKAWLSEAWTPRRVQRSCT